MVTGGSDCRGENADEPMMGRIRLPYGYVEGLKAAIEGMGRARGEAAQAASTRPDSAQAGTTRNGAPGGPGPAAPEESHP
ncbi:hypothetical protein LIP_2265 [Limnochorda pilosa]|uniref:Uncharacterized protein n=1 Tax=Limnochorda pilosa TaxID=1555112 RepID=A0A0K2SLV7_LIMPI|nr:hypothetical protein LIP_2265 [Limnochorda pilosa]